MDQDEAQQACVDPSAAAGDAAVCQAPPAEASAAAAPAPAAGDAANPVLASVPEAAVPEAAAPEADAGEADEAKEHAEQKEMGENMDAAGKTADFAGTMAKVAAGSEGAERAGGAVGGLLGLPGDIMAAADGAAETAKGDAQNGVIDTAIGAAGVAGDVASIAGASGVGEAANAIKGGLEGGKGIAQIADAATSDGPAPGQSGKDTASEAVDGVENLLKGAGDGSQAFGPEAAAVGKSLNFGMAVGNAIAPAVFGDKNEHIPDEECQTADGVYHGSTGNSVVDWVAGVGKYSNGRFSDSSAPKD